MYPEANSDQKFTEKGCGGLIPEAVPVPVVPVRAEGICAGEKAVECGLNHLEVSQISQLRSLWFPWLTGMTTCAPGR